MKTTTTTGGFFGRSARARNAAGLTAAVAIAGTVFASVAPVAPVQADPPAWAKVFGQRDRNDKRGDQRDVRQDKRDIGQDVRRLRQDQNDLRQDQRDVRRDDNRWDNDRDRRPAPPRPGAPRPGDGDDRRDNDRWRSDNRPGGWDNERSGGWDNRNDREDNNWRDRFDQVRQQDANRQKNKNDWRNLTILGGAATVYGLLKHDPTITFIGAAGTLYSASRYESDRKSQSQANRARAELFDRGYFERDGVRYTKRDKWQNGEHYYYFAR